MNSFTMPWTPARAGAGPASRGRIRERPEDFAVDEQLGFDASGDGPHALLRVEKTGCNTVEVARALANFAGVPVRDVGYCGLKDRHAVCRQWFSVPCASSVDWHGFSHPGARVLEWARHRRKLKRGTHRANRFAIRVALDALDRVDLDQRLRGVRSGGVPNYFGEQRFGRQYADNARHLASGRRLPRLERGMTLSAIRSELFNRVLDERVKKGNWNVALPGEYVNLDGTRSGFAAPGDDPEISERVAALDLHPTGPLYGAGESPSTGAAAQLEKDSLDPFQSWCDVLARHGLKMERRPTRCVVRDLEWQLDEEQAVLGLAFALRRGQFATSVLREILEVRDVTRVPGSRPAGSGQ